MLLHHAIRPGVPALVPSFVLEFGSGVLSPNMQYTRGAGAGGYVEGPSGYYEARTTGVPRFRYDPVSGACLGMLIEVTRTNLVTNTDMTADWVLTGAEVPLKAGRINPEGLASRKLTEDTSGGTQHKAVFTTAISANTSYCLSAFLRNGSRTKCYLRYRNGSGSEQVEVLVDLFAGTIGAPQRSGGLTSSNVVANILPWKDGWYRVSLSATIDVASTSGVFEIALADDTGNDTYDGDGTSGVFFWIPQFEAGGDPTTPIQAGATRGTEQLQTRSLLPWFNATEGTLLAVASRDYDTPLATFPGLASLTAASSNERISLSITTASDRPSGNILVGGVSQGALTAATAYTYGQDLSMVIAYKQDDFAMSVNGASPITDNAGNVPSLERLYLCSLYSTSNPLNGVVKRVVYWPRRLTNAQLQLVAAAAL